MKILGTVAMVFVAVLGWAALQAPIQAEPAQAAAPAAASEIYTDVYNGWKWWHVYCYRCHGVDAAGSTLAPNLTDPARKQTAADPRILIV